MISSCSFMPLPKLEETTVVRDREATGPWAGLSLTTVGPPATTAHLMNETEKTMYAARMDSTPTLASLVAAPVAETESVPAPAPAPVC